VIVRIEGPPPEPAEDDASLGDDDARVPAGVADARADLAEIVGEEAGRNVTPCEVARGRPLGLRSLARQAVRSPVLLPRDVVVDLSEAQGLEPPRGPWAQVSLVVVAVDDDWSIAPQDASGLAAQLLKREVERTGDVLFRELGTRQDLDDLGALRQQPAHLVATDLPRHGEHASQGAGISRIRD